MKKLLSISILVLLTALVASGDITYSRELDERAILGDAAAMHELSVCYRMGTGVAKDLDKANYWLERAAQEGNPNALATLELLDNKTSLTEAKRRELAAMEQRERERLLKAKEEQRLAEEQRRQEEHKKQEQIKKQTFTVNGVSFVMVEVKGGTFTMGATSEQGKDADNDEKPIHQVTLSSYYIGETEVTQALWEAVMGSNPSRFKGSNRPVERISWDDCQKFIKKLNEMTGKHFCLPTEAQWEFAARGGSKSRGYKYSGSNNINDVAWFDKNCDKGTHVVGTKLPNELGLYDMSGNVREWCRDVKGGYSSSAQTNPTGPKSSSSQVLRGGGWHDEAKNCRVSNRDRSLHDFSYHYLGLRLALKQQQEAAMPNIHEVKEGDNLYKLAIQYGTTPEAIRKANNITGEQIKIGQKLIIPVKPEKRDGKRGDSSTPKPKQEKKQESKPYITRTFTANGVSFTMVEVLGGTFTMGATSEQGGDAEKDENPSHQVMLSSYYIGETEVTQELWQAVMGRNPSKYKGDKHPVENVTWMDCQEFIKKLNKITGKRFRLPTEAEWEFAARGGNLSKEYKYSGSNNLDDVSWYVANSSGMTHPVATKLSNELGLYDMSGNVWEWCSDWYGSYISSAQSNPTGPDSGSFRVSRGGSWDYGVKSCRVSGRFINVPSFKICNLGLRLAL